MSKIYQVKVVDNVEGIEMVPEATFFPLNNFMERRNLLLEKKSFYQKQIIELENNIVGIDEEILLMNNVLKIKE